MGLFSRRSEKRTERPNPVAIWLSADGSLPTGYHRLRDCPEITGLLDRMTAIISNATIYLMENTKTGDVRIRDRLARKIDIDPWRMGTRQVWMAWIVETLLCEGDGNAFVLPRYDPATGLLLDLEPMPGAVIRPSPDRRGYSVAWRGVEYPHDAVLHFRLFPDPDEPWRGRGYRFSAQRLADTLGGLNDMELSLSSPDWKPPMIVYADVDSDFFDDDKRAELRRKYLEDADRGKPWILPSDVMKVDQIKPLSFADLAIKDTSELNRTALATLFGAPPFLLGVGEFDRYRYNTWIRTTILPICHGITQVLTAGLLENPDRYFTMPEKRLYAYTPMEMVTMGLAMSDRGYVNGDEVRDMAMMDPAGLTEFRALENYIPYDMAAMQTKLTGGDKDA